jgi:hypothetical protein
MASDLALSAGSAPERLRQAAALPERATVPWRRPVDEVSLRRSARWWTLTTLAHTLPFLLAAPVLFLLKPITTPIGIVLLIHAWAIPELYAARGAGVLRPRRRASAAAERRAMLLLGDLVDEPSRRLYAATGLVTASGRLGTWVVGEAGALLVRPGGHRVNCYCVRVPDPDLPAADRVAHLLLALRCDETGLATVANLAFSGAAWRVRRRLRAEQSPALDIARELARAPTARALTCRP